MIAPSPRPTITDDVRQSQAASSAVAASVKPSSSQTPRAVFWRKKLKEMPGLNCSARSRNGVSDLGATSLAAEPCEHREFRGPVERENHERGERAEPLRNHPARRSAFSSRNAAASRGVTSGYSGSAVAGSK